MRWETDITQLVNDARVLNDSRDYSLFEPYRNRLIQWTKEKLISVDNPGAKDILIRILELHVDYPKWYRAVILFKFKPDVLHKWHEQGKYQLYLDRVISLLESLRFRTGGQQQLNL